MREGGMWQWPVGEGEGGTADTVALAAWKRWLVLPRCEKGSQQGVSAAMPTECQCFNAMFSELSGHCRHPG